MKPSLVHELLLALACLDLSSNDYRDLEELVSNKDELRRIFDLSRTLRSLAESEVAGPPRVKQDRPWGQNIRTERLSDFVSTRRDITIKQLADLAEQIYGRKLRPGKLGKKAFAHKIEQVLSRDELNLLVSELLRQPRFDGSKERDEWFHYMNRRLPRPR